MNYLEFYMFLVDVNNLLKDISKSFKKLLCEFKIMHISRLFNTFVIYFFMLNSYNLLMEFTYIKQTTR